MGTIIQSTIEIARPPEAVFDYLSDVRNEREWNPDCLSVEKLTGGPVGVGTRFLAKWKQGPAIDTECTAFDRPRRFQYQNGGPMSLVLTITLDPTQLGGTRMTSHGEWTPHGWFRLIFPLFIRMMRRAHPGVVDGARRALEERRDVSTAVAVPIRAPQS